MFGRERFASSYDNGEIIAGEGPGKGFASYPWALDEYERALGLKPLETWLMKRMLRHSWEKGTLVFVSFRKVCRDADISRETLAKAANSLKAKGYLSDVGRLPYSHKVKFDVTGIYEALLTAIKCNPKSKWAKTSGVTTIFDQFEDSPDEWRKYHTPAEINRWYAARGERFDWSTCTSEPWNNEPDRVYTVICIECDAEFEAFSLNAKYCPDCREHKRQERWENFKQAFLNLADVMEEVDDIEE